MTPICCRIPFAMALIFASAASCLVADDAPDWGDLPAPITTSINRDPGSLDDLGEGPVKARPYTWMVDDAVTPISQSTISSFATNVADVDPNYPLERPGVPVGWFGSLESTAANARVSSRQQSEGLLSGSFANPVSVPFAPLDWTAMPKITLGFRQPEGLGEFSASYRFLITQGSDVIPAAGGAALGSGSSSLQLHVLDLDYTLTDLFPTDLCFVPRQIRLTGGVRVAGIYDKASASGGTILGQSASNTFVGAGPRFALESLYPISRSRWTLFGKVDAAGIIGSDRQTFSQTTIGPGGASASASSNPSTVAVPVVGVRAGVNWLPAFGGGKVKLSTGFQCERWYYLGADTSSFNELTILGPFFRGEVAF